MPDPADRAISHNNLAIYLDVAPDGHGGVAHMAVNFGGAEERYHRLSRVAFLEHDITKSHQWALV